MHATILAGISLAIYKRKDIPVIPVVQLAICDACTPPGLGLGAYMPEIGLEMMFTKPPPCAGRVRDTHYGFHQVTQHCRYGLLSHLNKVVIWGLGAYDRGDL